VLDLRFSSAPHTGDICAVVDSTAGLTILRLFPDLAQPLQQLLSHRIPGIGTNILFLSCAWHPTVAHIIAVSTSTGEIHILNLSDDLTAVLGSQGPILRHSLEAWCVALMPQPCVAAKGAASRFTLCSGADDSILQLAECELADFTSIADFNVHLLEPPFEVMGHTAGVTAILPLPLITDDGLTILITGSYDEKVRVYAIRAGRLGSSPPCSYTLLSELGLGGGVWRMNLISLQQDGRVWRAMVLASCMHAGVRVVEIAGDGGSSSNSIAITVKARFEEHKSMNYASDFQPSLSGAENIVCISTSFYDRLLCLWKVSLHRAAGDRIVVVENGE
jgi:diphthine methyl ester acylhydrolase